MRNLLSCLMIGLFVYISSAGFHWYYLLLLAGAVLFWEYPARENMELLREQIEEVRARTENIRWQTKLSQSQVSVNLTLLKHARGR